MNDNKPLAALSEELERIGNEAANAIAPRASVGGWHVRDPRMELEQLRFASERMARAILLISQAMKDVK